MSIEIELTRRQAVLGAVAAAAAVAARPLGALAATADELVELTATTAVSKLKAGAFSAREYADALLAQSARLRHLNAFISQDPAALHAAAEAIDKAGKDAGGLHGVPLAIKDNMDTTALPTTSGTPALKGWMAKANAPVVQAILDAGGLIAGKANMHELAFGITNNNATYGAAHNPYDIRMIPGGSSGGTAVAVGARLAPAGLGSDTGGSCRIPAALCGCVGFRPTLGRYSQAGVVPISSTRDTPGPLARSVEDVQLIDSVCATDSPKRENVALSGLRLGLPRAYFYDNLDPELAKVMEEALAALRRAGATLVEVDVPNLQALNDAVSFPVALYEVVRELGAYLARGGNSLSVLDLIEHVAGPGEKGILQSQLGADAVPAVAYRAALVQHRPKLQAAYADYFTDNDVAAMVVPTTPLPARPIGQDETVELNGEQVPTFFTFIRNCDPPSNAGVPCLSVPAGLTAGGLPVGLELVGPEGTDARVLGIGRAVESVLPLLPAPKL
jgi:mandelamide amidase